MSEDLLIAGKTYVSSKKAATITGYAQDYIGQLARGGFIEAQRVGGLWYVYLDSLTSHKSKSAEFKPQPPVRVPAYDPESVVSFDGRDYISANRAAKITGYNQDYIGQLARSGKVLSRQIGNRWYVDREGLVAHKAEKDRLLAAVQTESVGLSKSSYAGPAPLTPPSVSTPTSSVSAYNAPYAPQQRFIAPVAQSAAMPPAISTGTPGPVLTYFSENKDLLPRTKNHESLVSKLPVRVVPRLEPEKVPTAAEEQPMERPEEHVATDMSETVPKKRSYAVARPIMALTIIVVLSFGLFSLKGSSLYASVFERGPSLTHSGSLASAARAVGSLGDVIESLVVRELVYIRK